MGQVKIENAEIREAVERAKREHVHDWALELEEAYGGQFYCAAHCTICHLEMPIDETNRRLNATERLSGGDAFYAGAQLDEAPDDVPKDLRDYKHGVRLALLDYASVLEGENDQSS